MCLYSRLEAPPYMESVDGQSHKGMAVTGNSRMRHILARDQEVGGLGGAIRE
jgi:hypothetical protein